MKVLVLGGHGFVGSHVVGQMREGPHQVVALSRRDGVDLTDLSATRRALAGVGADVIVNCAAHVGSVHYVSAKAATVFHDNVQIALNLYKAVQAECPAARVINPLSNCSYPGDADVHYEPDWWRGEVHGSVYSYGNAKRFIYVTSACYKREFGTRTINLLVPNTFGPGDYTDPNKTHALNGMIIRMLGAHREGKPEFEIWGTGKPVREWAFIKDVARLLVQAVDLPEERAAELTYPVNMAQNRGYTIAESATAIADAIGFGGRLVFNTSYQDGAMRKVLDDRKFRATFSDFRFAEHAAAIRETVAYYQSVM